MSWRIRSPKTLAHHWPFNGHYNDIVRGQNGTPHNSLTWATNQFGRQCIELDGNNTYVSFGDITALNAVSAFTITFWMNQDVLDVIDTIFTKTLDGGNRIVIQTHSDSGHMWFFISNGGAASGRFDYSTIISAGGWYHIAMVFDGSQADDAGRLQVYVGGIPVALVYTGTIPATTADLTGRGAAIGFTSFAFDGKLSDFRLFYVPLTRDEVNQIIHEPKPTY